MSNAADVNNVIASLPANIQDAIKALVAQEIAKAAPEAPRALTPREQAQLHLQIARAHLQSPGSVTSFYDRILSTLEMLVEKAYPEESAAPESTSSAAPAVESAAT